MKLSAPIYQLKRKAKLLARDKHIPLHAALDYIAHEEGYRAWSLLSAQATTDAAPACILPKFDDGDMVLLGARPGQGKTFFAVRLLLAAIKDGRRGVMFTLEYTKQEILGYVRSCTGQTEIPRDDELEVVTSDKICADYIMAHSATAPAGTVLVIDYLQLLDQRREHADLTKQLQDLYRFAQRTDCILVFISQIDRTFETQSRAFPEVQDIRMPNAIDFRVFSKACFLQKGEMQFVSLS